MACTELGQLPCSEPITGFSRREVAQMDVEMEYGLHDDMVSLQYRSVCHLVTDYLQCMLFSLSYWTFENPLCNFAFIPPCNRQ